MSSSRDLRNRLAAPMSVFAAIMAAIELVLLRRVTQNVSERTVPSSSTTLTSAVASWTSSDAIAATRVASLSGYHSSS